MTQNLNNFLYKEKKTLMQNIIDKIRHFIRLVNLVYYFAPVVIVYTIAWILDVQ